MCNINGSSKTNTIYVFEYNINKLCHFLIFFFLKQEKHFFKHF